MGIDEITIRRLHLNDAPFIKAAGVFSGSRTAVEDKIRKIISDTGRFAYVIESKGEVTAFSFLTPAGLSKDTYYLDFFCTDQTLLQESLSRTLYHVLLEKHLHKIDLVIESSNKPLEKAAFELGMIQNAVLVDEIGDNDGKYKDAGLFYITLPEYKGYNVGFVPFQRGVACVYGTEDYIDRVNIYHYGDEPRDHLTLTVSKRLELLDENKRFKPRNSKEYYDLDNSFLPSEVEKGVNELTEYFLKKRETFDLNLSFRDCTGFQERVWRALTTIPYGLTVSYEDLALKVAPDGKEARKLTRAVGAACSDNPIPLIVPCHRVIGKDGKLVGFAAGLDIKDFLLQHESVFMTLL